VPQELHSGLPPPGAEKRRGYNPRNAPFGADVAHGKEHLSSVHEEYLGSLARKTGLAYVHLAADTDLLQNMVNRAAPRYMNVPIDLTPWLAAVGLFALATMYLFVVFAKLLRAARKRAVRVPIDRLQPISQLRGAAL
jgi:mxaL protein